MTIPISHEEFAITDYVTILCHDDLFEMTTCPSALVCFVSVWPHFLVGHSIVPIARALLMIRGPPQVHQCPCWDHLGESFVG